MNTVPLSVLAEASAVLEMAKDAARPGNRHVFTLSEWNRITDVWADLSAAVHTITSRQQVEVV